MAKLHRVSTNCPLIWNYAATFPVPWKHREAAAAARYRISRLKTVANRDAISQQPAIHFEKGDQDLRPTTGITPGCSSNECIARGLNLFQRTQASSQNPITVRLLEMDPEPRRL
jgi:hypothetical protein